MRDAGERTIAGALLMAVALVACAGKPDPTAVDAGSFAPGMNAYLQKRGMLCLDYATWPVDVSEHDVAVGAREARQMPVLESLGLVSSRSLPVIVPVTDGNGAGVNETRATRYQLTSAGRIFFVDRQTRRPPALGSAGGNGHSDICAVTLTLNKIVSWQVQKAAGGEPARATVTYTYNADAPSWARDPRFGQVFPAVARLLRGAGSAPLVEGFTLTSAGWTANEVLSPPAPPVQVVRR